jgi:hypothetical protein
MDALKLVAGHNCYTNDIAAPRLLFRPGTPTGAPTLDLDEPMLRSGILAFPRAEAPLAGCIDWLEAEAARQAASPPTTPGWRIAWLDTDGSATGAAPLGGCMGHRDGRIVAHADSRIPLGREYGILVANARLSFAGGILGLDASAPGTAPHRLLRYLALDATRAHFSVMRMSMDLAGSNLGCLKAEGAFGRMGAAGPASSLPFHHDMGLASAFVDMLRVDTGFGMEDRRVVTMAALIHAGEGFGKVGRLEALLDPFNIRDRARSWVRLLPATGDQALELAATATAGHTVQVRAAGGNWSGEEAPRFIFTSRFTGDETVVSGAREDSLTLIGDYEAVSGAGASESGGLDVATLGIMPGFSPSEALRPDTAGPTEAAGPLLISFAAGPGRVDKALPTDPEHPTRPMLVSGAESHQDLATWMRVRRGAGAMEFVAEAPSARTLAAEVTATGGGVVLAHTPLIRTPAARAAEDGVPNAAAGFLPVLPPRGVSDDGGTLARAFDQGMLARERVRRSPLRLATAGPGEAAANAAVTPLGFEIIRDAAGTPREIVFARATGGDAEAKFSFVATDTGTINPELLDALSRNRLFLVLPHLQGLGQTDLRGRIDIGGWTFKADLPRAIPVAATPAKRTDPLIIVKNHADGSIASLAAQPEAWSRRDLLAGVEVATLDRLTRFVERAKTIAGGGVVDGMPATPADRTRYSRLVDDILDRKDWQGVLVIDAGIDLGNVPLQVKGIMSGLDTGALKAVYIAVPVKPLPTGKAPTTSRLQALVDYRGDATDPPKSVPDPEFPGATTADDADSGSFGFDVQRLVVEFARGEVSDFDAKVRLLIKRLFLAEGKIQMAKKPTGGALPGWKPADHLDINGRFERRRDGDTVVESYVFSTEDLYRYVSALPNGDPEALIKSVLIERVAYETAESGQPDSAGDRAVRSAFRISGEIAFGTIPVISGLDDILDIDIVSFNDMQIGVDSLLNALTNAARTIRMAFRLGAIDIDFGTARRRSGGSGFWSSFPLSFRKLRMFDGPLNLGELGYFGVGKFPDSLRFRFGFEFDLDLGTLGALASFKNLRLGVLLAFADGGRLLEGGLPRITLGFRLPEGDGSLDIGIQGILKLKARRYGLCDAPYSSGNPPVQRTAKMLYGVGTRLEIFGKDMPNDDNLTMAIIVDPAGWSVGGQTKGPTGWFIARKPEGAGSEIMPGVELHTLMIGQRIDPIPGMDVRTTKEFVRATDRLTAGGGAFATEETDPQKAALRVVKALQDQTIKFAPDRNWSLALDATLADIIRIGVAMRDADIYGLRLELLVEGDEEADPEFAFDILYRKLSDRLGVYSLEIVPPASLRQIEFGAVSIDLPNIGIEIFTDGGFTIDFGYPWDKDYARAFGVQVLPFLGSGGFYYRQVSGPGAMHVPQPRVLERQEDGTSIIKLDPDVLLYSPVIEAGMAFRVGLGKEIDRGILKAGLSLTVFASLEGGFGVLKRTDKFLPAKHSSLAAKRFFAVRGTVGIMGEIYGYVDFGIVKAGVAVRVWVATGIDFRTDHRTRLYIEAGVSVSVRVVIGRIKIFGKRIEISISFSFATTIDYSTYVGKDQNLEYYAPPGRSAEAGIVMVPATTRETARVAGFDWSVVLNPSDWRPPGQNGTAPDKLAPVIRFSPDVTLASSGATMQPQAVMLLMVPVVENAPSDIDATPALLAAWAHKAAFGEAGRATRVSVERLEELSRALSEGPGGRAGAVDRLTHLPDASAIMDILRRNMDARFEETPEGEHTEPGLFWPLPPGVSIQRHDGTAAQNPVIDIATKAVVDDNYRRKINDEMRKLMALIETRRGAEAAAEAGPPAASIVDAVFVEHAVLLMRGAAVQLLRLAEAQTAGVPGAETTLGDLLDALTLDVEEGKPARPGPARQLLESATRLQLHGPRLPWPALADADRSLVPADLDPATGPFGLYRLGWLQVPLDGATADTRIKIDIKDAYGANAGLFSGSVSPDDLAKLARLGNAPALGGAFADTQVVRREQALRHAGRSLVRKDAGPLVMLDPLLLSALADLRDPVAADPSLRLVLRQLRGHGDSQEAADVNAAPAIAVRVRLRPRRPDGGGNHLDVFECLGMSEADRVLLDRFEEGTNGELIEGLELYATLDGKLCRVGAGQTITIAQTDGSAEPQPATATEAKEAAARIAARFVATVPPEGLAGGGTEDPAIERSAFVEIIRRTAIVNRGGTLLGWQGAEAAFARADKDDAFDAHLVVRLTAGGQSFANAMLVPTGNGQDFTAEFAGNEETLLRTAVAEPTAEAGVLSIRAVREASVAPAGIDPAAWGSVRDRFSMLAVGVSLVDGAGLSPLLRSAEALAIGPEQDEKDAANGTLRYAGVVALSNLLGQESPYDCIGQRLRLHGTWRDIYGNDWAGSRFDSDELTVHYNDRLVPLTDLPGFAASWWPLAQQDRAGIRFRLEKRWARDLEVAITDDRNATLDRLDRAAAAYTRTFQQIADKHVVVEVLAGDAPPVASAVLRQALLDTLGAARIAVNGLRQLLAQPTRPTLGEIETILSNVNTIAQVDQPIPDQDAVELRLGLRVRRTAFLPADRTPDMASYEIDVPLALVDDSRGAVFGGSLLDLQELAWSAFSTQRMVATGLSGRPGVGGAAVWLIKRTMLPPPDHFSSIVKADKARVFATPPVSRSLHSADFTGDEAAIGWPVASDAPQSFRAIDADAEAAIALDAYEGILKPDMVQRFIASPAGRAALDDIMRAKAGEQGIASLLALRTKDLRHGAASAAADRRAALAKRVLEDRFRASLAAADAIDAVVVLGDEVEDGHSPEGPLAFGRLTTSEGPFTARPFVMTAGGNGRRHDLAIAVDAAPSADGRGGEPASIVTFSGAYRITHIQRNSNPDGAAGELARYRPTAWLALLPPPTGTGTTLPDWTPQYELTSEVKVPIVRKRYPQQPVLLAEAAQVPAWGSGEPVTAKIRQWTSGRIWSSPAAPTDTLVAKLRYNPSGSADGVAPEKPDASETARARAFLRFARTVPLALQAERRRPSGNDEAFATYLQRECRRLADGLRPRAAETSAPIVNILDIIDVQEEVGLAHRKIRVVREVDERIRDTRLKLGVCRADLTIVEDRDVSGGVEWEPTPPILAGLQFRSLVSEGLDIVILRGVQTELTVFRNKRIGGVIIDDAFVYRTATVASGAPLTPRIDIAEAPAATSARPLGQHLLTLVRSVVDLPAALLAEDQEALLGGLSLDIIITFEPVLHAVPGGASTATTGDGIHVAGFSRLNLSGAPEEWLGPLQRAVENWFGTVKPPDGRFVCDMRLTERLPPGAEAARETDRPLLRLRRGLIPRALVT